MKKTAIAFVAFIAILPAGQGLADDGSYLEIGGIVQREQAQGQWQTLVEQHPKLLKGLEFHPHNVEGGTQIQAGPVSGTGRSQRICEQLFKENISCFVIEDYTPVTAAAAATVAATDSTSSLYNIEDSAVVPVPPEPPSSQPQQDQILAQASAPVTADSIEAPSPPPAKRRGLFSWLGGRQSAPAPEEKTQQADVQVAEAIRVPLTDNTQDEPAVQTQVAEVETAPIEPPAAPLVEPPAPPPVVEAPKPLAAAPVVKAEPVAPAAPAPQTAPVAPKPVAKTQAPTANLPGWLNVYSFADENAASAFWQQLSPNLTDKALRLHVRINRPFLARSGNQTVLNVGPFDNSTAANAFCYEAIQAANSALRCQFNPSAPEATAAANVAPAITQMRFTHGDAYAARRQRLQSHHRQPGEEASSSYSPGKQYWVTLLSAPNRAAAVEGWEELRDNNQDILRGMRSNISAAANNSRKYVVRVGPLTQEKTASSLCGSLRDRGIRCSVSASR